MAAMPYPAYRTPSTEATCRTDCRMARTAYPAYTVPIAPAAPFRKCNIQNHYLTNGYY
jgi:hypothetical protein